MQSTYCVSCKKMTGNKNAKVFKTKKWEITVKICSVCGKKNLDFFLKMKDLSF